MCVLCSSLCDLSGSFDASSDSHMTDRRDRSVLLSPTVLIGPSDAVLNQPIKIKLPHCLSYQNNSWHLQVCILTHHTPSHITHPHTSHSYNHASLILAHAYPQLVLALILPPSHPSHPHRCTVVPTGQMRTIGQKSLTQWD